MRKNIAFFFFCIKFREKPQTNNVDEEKCRRYENNRLYIRENTRICCFHSHIFSLDGFVALLK